MGFGESKRKDQASVSEAGLVKSERIVSLDALRGFTMFWIIGGSTVFIHLARAVDVEFLKALIPQMHHVRWEGLHFMDLIWPMFFFLVGSVMPFSLGKRVKAGDKKISIYLHIIKRAAILFIIGMFLQGELLTYNMEQFRPFHSVLHGIGAGYLIASILFLNLKIRWQIIVTCGLLLLYWALMTLIPVPDYGAGVLTAQGNLATFIDKAVQGRFHFGNNTWFLSYMTFTCSVMLGVFAGYILKLKINNWQKVLWLMTIGGGCIGLGILWSQWFAIIKLIWTSSYVLVAGGYSFILLAVFYMLFDVLKLRKCAFGFVVIGSNAIAVYAATILFDFSQVGNVFVGGLADRLGDYYGLVQATAAFAVVWLILFGLYRKKIFFKI